MKEADVVFAKDELIDYCQQNGYNYIIYKDFADVLHTIKKFEREGVLQISELK